MLKSSDPIVLLCARLTELTYESFDSEEFIRGVSALDLKHVRTFDRAGVEAMCAVLPNGDVMVCFPGTNDGADWMANLSTKKIRHQYLRAPAGCMVHVGFHRTYCVVEHDVLSYIMKYRESPANRIVFTGHSLGGAMATQAAFSWDDVVVRAVVTFGCPRVGNKAFVEFFNSRHHAHTLRFTNNNDVVPRAPFKWMGYAHVWNQVHFDRRGNLNYPYRPNFWQKAWDGLAGRVRNLARLKVGDGISDHSMYDYRKLVEEAYHAPKG